MIPLPLLSFFIALFTVTNVLGLPQLGRQSPPQASLPQNDPNATARAEAIALTRAGWQYGPALLGGSFFPTGPLALARIQRDVGLYTADAVAQNNSINLDLPGVEEAVIGNGGFHSLNDYTNLLYANKWTNAVPGGEDTGILTNYTQDLLFSMERLSLNPYPVRRVKVTDTLPFQLDDSTAISISTLTLQGLQAAGRLFVADHSYQAAYPKNARFGAFCTAYFFIHPVNGDFLPLAIKTNTGADLIYTPLDSANDWLLAKIMFNNNDLFQADMFHLLASHDVGEILHQAAIRTLSAQHPVLIVLERLMTEAFAPRVVGSQVFFNPGGAFDQIYFTNASGAIQFVNQFYPTGGAYKANYLETDLIARGLLPSESFPGPALKNFPFYEDASQIRNVIQAFMTALVNTYYANDAVVFEDTELSAWFTEANGPAQVMDFPCMAATLFSPSCGKNDLIEILTHFAYLSGVLHHALNTGDLTAASGTLPFHPAALWAPLPKTKGLTSEALLTYLPPPTAAIFQCSLDAAFNRPQYASQARTLAVAYSDVDFTSQFSGAVELAARQYTASMLNISASIQGRRFDANGLSQGMPFIWKALDPGTVPFFFAV